MRSSRRRSTTSSTAARRLLERVVDVSLLRHASGVHLALRLDVRWQLVPPDPAADALRGLDLGRLLEKVADEARMVGNVVACRKEWHRRQRLDVDVILSSAHRARDDAEQEKAA